MSITPTELHLGSGGDRVDPGGHTPEVCHNPSLPIDPNDRIRIH